MAPRKREDVWLVKLANKKSPDFWPTDCQHFLEMTLSKGGKKQTENYWEESLHPGFSVIPAPEEKLEDSENFEAEKTRP